MLKLEIVTGSAARSATGSSTLNSFKIYVLEPEFYSGQDTHERTYGRTDGQTDYR